MSLLNKPVRKLIIYSSIGLALMFLIVGLSTVLMGFDSKDVKEFDPINNLMLFRVGVYLFILLAWKWIVGLLIKKKYQGVKIKADDYASSSEFTLEQYEEMEKAEKAKLLSNKTRIWVFLWICFVEVIVIRQGQGVFY